MSDLTYQQEVVYQQRENALKSVLEANDKLDDKANVLITGCSIIIGLVAGANFFSAPGAGVLVNVLSALIFVTFLLMLMFASRLWSPRTLIIPGPGDINTMYKLYISCDADDAYDQALTDLAHAVTQARIANGDKSRWLVWMIRAFQLQMVLLVLALVSQLL